MIRRVARPRRKGLPRGVALACAAAVALVPTACGGDDPEGEADGDGDEMSAADEPVGAEPDAADDPEAAEPDAADEPDDGEPADSGFGSDGGLGTGTAIVTFDGEEYRFATGDGALAGQCRNLYDVLVVDLPLVEANGAAIPPDTGRLELQVELDAVPDYEPWADLSVPGGRWFAGDDEVAAITGIETPDMTLTASGNTITGTQAMVPMVVGINSEIEATIEVTCA